MKKRIRVIKLDGVIGVIPTKVTISTGVKFIKKNVEIKMKIIIVGRPASKKNNRRNFDHISLPSKAYMAFEESALYQLMGHRPKYGTLTGPVEVDYIFYQKGRMRQDLDNAIASIGDVLEKAGVIEDDNQIEIIRAEKHHGNKDWSTEILITDLDSERKK